MKWKSVYVNQSVHPGEQPIRVLVQNMIYTFENVYKEFRMEAKTFYDEFGLERGLPYILGLNPLISDDDDLFPYIESDESQAKRIYLSETFFSYLWGVVYCLFTDFYELMFIPAKTHTYQLIRLERMHRAHQLFQYALSLRYAYTPWKKTELPNPELFPESETEYIGMVNHAFTRATTLVLCHELAHAQLRHLDTDREANELEDETEADYRAFDMILRGIKNDSEKLNAVIGTIGGLCALLFFSETTEAEKHPDTDERIFSFMKRLELQDHDALWGIPCISYRLWDAVYDIGFDYGNRTGTYRELFESIYHQERRRRE